MLRECRFHDQKAALTVERTGAAPKSVLCGTEPHNLGLRVRVLQAQRGAEGSIEGPFVLLNVGRNKHAAALKPRLGRTTNAREVLGLIRRQFRRCVSVVNANALAVEATPQLLEGIISNLH